MNLSRYSVFMLSLGLSSPAFSFAEIRLVTTKPEILEVLGAYSPGPAGSQSTRPIVVMPFQKTFSTFGGLFSYHPFTIENQKEIIKKRMENKINLNPSYIVNMPRPVCGASPETNTLNCFDLNRNGQYLNSYPIPGSLSTTPIFSDNSWLIGTSKGFLIRAEANIENKFLPQLGESNTALWGANSRKYMKSFRPKPIYTEQGKASGTTSSTSAHNLPLPQGIKWVFPSSSQFVGTPIVQNGFAYLFSANQYIQAINWSTGKLAWTVRLAPDANLRMGSNALLATSSEVIAGTELGTLLILNPTNGSIMWTWQVPSATAAQREQTQLAAGPDRFSSLAAKPLLYERNIIVSNAESITQNISLDAKSSLWSYPIGSVAQPKIYKENVLLGSATGKIVSLNLESGNAQWSLNLTDDSSPIMSLFLTKSGVLLAASSRGQIYMVNPETGKLLAKNLPIGETNGEFFAGYGNSDACISFSQNGFRCFYAKVK
ncbi:PQQ-binding-like beta-propeller repeat protein [Silvanigrella aquatica]|uniref:Pyrrolo-quinoline quinone repeat domain-containing protein n=1 Tax=Silvanigrella aquatica TaxID=1915309 RepID=A0A1L4CXS5_9BACT|nr:PQQ-binding-like beta-propeller repeat protein [Silvanigrella aquatica]APJ02749.1 hypothetical protein AXG55_01940 [Silvanigrella aquatica]